MKINSLGFSGTTSVKNKKTSNNPIKSNQQNQVKMQDSTFAYSSSIAFTRKWSEHKSWGAVVDPKTKDVTFKLFTFPNARRVTVTIEKQDGSEETTITLKNKGQGIFETAKPISSEHAQDGDNYYFTIEKADKTKVQVKDPYSFKQNQLLNKSVIYDQSKYKWNDKKWYSPDNSERISRLANSKNNLKTLDEAKIYELNVATFSKSGDFKGASKKLDEIVKSGFNAIEIMPVENTASFNWGYDGVDKFAVSKFLGGPDEFKKFVDLAHSKNLNVIIDMVPNHHGPDGSQLGQTGPYLKGPNNFGDAYNYEGRDSMYVRDFMVNAALNWLNNYHCDGIRFDMTKFMESDITMKQIAAEINYHNPDAFLIAEDSRQGIATNGINFWNDHTKKHDQRVLAPLKAEEYGKGQSEEIHNQAIEKIENNQTNLARLGYDSEWDFNYYHTLKDSLYGNSNLDSFVDACLKSGGRVKYVTSHDEIGNFEGSRLIAKLMVPMLHLNENVTLNEKDYKRANDLSKLKGYDFETAKNNVRFQKAQLTSEKLATMLQNGKLDKYLETNDYEAFKNEVLIPLGISESANITPRLLRIMHQKAYNTFKMATTLTYSLKGPKMTFQGDEEASLTPFRFFRQFDSIPHEPYLDTEKGYESGWSAYGESKLDSFEYGKIGQKCKDDFKNLTRAINFYTDITPAISKGDIVQENIVKHYGSQVVGLHQKDKNSESEIFTITNFSDMSYPRDDADKYYIRFPKGEWQEIINTDSEDFGGKGLTNPKAIIKSDGKLNSPINLAAKSTAIFVKRN